MQDRLGKRAHHWTLGEKLRALKGSGHRIVIHAFSDTCVHSFAVMVMQAMSVSLVRWGVAHIDTHAL